MAETIALKYSPDRREDKKWDLDGLEKELAAEYHMEIPVKSKMADMQVSVDSIMDVTAATVMSSYETKISTIPDEVVKKVSSYVISAIDQNWKDHLKAMDELQESS